MVDGWKQTLLKYKDDPNKIYILEELRNYIYKEYIPDFDTVSLYITNKPSNMRWDDYVASVIVYIWSKILTNDELYNINYRIQHLRIHQLDNEKDLFENLEYDIGKKKDTALSLISYYHLCKISELMSSILLYDQNIDSEFKEKNPDKFKYIDEMNEKICKHIRQAQHATQDTFNLTIIKFVYIVSQQKIKEIYYASL